MGYKMDNGELVLLQSSATAITKGTTVTSQAWDVFMVKTVDAYVQINTVGLSTGGCTATVYLDRSYNRTNWVNMWSTVKAVAKNVTSTAWFFNNVGSIAPYVRSRVKIAMVLAATADTVKVNVAVIGYNS